MGDALAYTHTHLRCQLTQSGRVFEHQNFLGLLTEGTCAAHPSSQSRRGNLTMTSKSSVSRLMGLRRRARRRGLTDLSTRAMLSSRKAVNRSVLLPSFECLPTSSFSPLRLPPNVSRTRTQALQASSVSVPADHGQDAWCHWSAPGGQ